MKIDAPFSPDQVAALNRFQLSGSIHPFTCGNNHNGPRDLVATPAGWTCPGCDYRQYWAHDFMLLPPADPLSAIAALQQDAETTQAGEGQ